MLIMQVCVRFMKYLCCVCQAQAGSIETAVSREVSTQSSESSHEVQSVLQEGKRLMLFALP